MLARRTRAMHDFFFKIYEPPRVRRAQTMRHLFTTQVYSKSLEIYYSVHSCTDTKFSSLEFVRSRRRYTVTMGRKIIYF